MTKTVLISDASLLWRTVYLVTRMMALRTTMMKTMKSSKINRWMCVVLITTNNSWMRGIQNAWNRINNLSIHFKCLKVLRILFLIFRIFLFLQSTFMRQQEKWRCNMMWWQKYISIRLKMAILLILLHFATVISPIINKIICLNIISRCYGHHIKSLT
jgi:hypothetical protein